MVRKTAAALCGILSMFAAAQAGEATALLDSFEGRWISDGPAFGGEAESSMVWAPVFKEKFFRLDYRVAVMQEEGAPFVFEGVAHYQLQEGSVLGAYWADNSGDLHPIRAERDGEALIAHWGVEGAKRGRTRYELLPSGAIEVTDWIRTDEGWRQFNQNSFVKDGTQ